MELQALREQLAEDDRQAWLKFVLGPTVNGLSPVWCAQAIVGPQPDDWELVRWSYPECTFVSTELSVRQFADLLVPGTSQTLRIGSDVASFEFSNGGFGWYRHASHQKYADLDLAWPSTTLTPGLSLQNLQAPNDYLVAPDVPSFPHFAGAHAAFFSDIWEQSGRNNSPLNQFIIRVVDERARISRVLVEVSYLHVWADGNDIVGKQLELNSSTDRLEMTISRAGENVAPLPHGLGKDAWVWLKDDNGWVDYRSLGSWGGSRSSDVEIETPDDPVADISALATQGENTWLEYKRQLPENTKESKRTALKGIVAFANGEGGTLLYGVAGSDNAGEIVGLAGKPDVLLRQVNDWIRALVTPNLSVRIKGNDVDSRFVIRVDVDPNQGIIYALAVDATKPEFYVRRNGSTYFAHPDELAALVKPATDSMIPRYDRVY